eukprot:4435472-Prymnesium_polylepis.1
MVARMIVEGKQVLWSDPCMIGKEGTIHALWRLPGGMPGGPTQVPTPVSLLLSVPCILLPTVLLPTVLLPVILLPLKPLCYPVILLPPLCYPSCSLTQGAPPASYDRLRLPSPALRLATPCELLPEWFTTSVLLPTVLLPG